MRIDETEDKSGVRVAGRGVLHLSVLMETMRREGFEFQVGRPSGCGYKTDEHGNKLSPSRRQRSTFPTITRARLSRLWAPLAAHHGRHGFRVDFMTHLVFRIPSRGTMGLKTRNPST